MASCAYNPVSPSTNKSKALNFTFFDRILFFLSVIFPFFYFVFEPQVLESAPQTLFAALHVQKELIPEMITKIVTKMPHVSTINVSEMALQFGVCHGPLDPARIAWHGQGGQQGHTGARAHKAQQGGGAQDHQGRLLHQRVQRWDLQPRAQAIGDEGLGRDVLPLQGAHTPRQGVLAGADQHKGVLQNRHGAHALAGLADGGHADIDQAGAHCLDHRSTLRQGPVAPRLAR
jgi:hypothetical protein